MAWAKEQVEKRQAECADDVLFEVLFRRSRRRRAVVPAMIERAVNIGRACLQRNERIFETYYAYALNKSFTLTADYQFITNPAYNADRGPVHIFSGRLHGEF